MPPSATVAKPKDKTNRALAKTVNKATRAAKPKPVKRSPATSAELVRIRKENLIGHMAVWVYRRNMELATGADGEGAGSASETEFARVLDISKSYLSLIKSGGKQIHDKLAAQFERCLFLEPGELDRQVPSFPTAALGASAQPGTGEALRTPSVPILAEDSMAQFTQTAQAAWARLTPPQRTQLQRLLAQPGLAELLSFLQFSNADNSASTMKDTHAQHSQRTEG